MDKVREEKRKKKLIQTDGYRKRERGEGRERQINIRWVDKKIV